MTDNLRCFSIYDVPSWEKKTLFPPRKNIFISEPEAHGLIDPIRVKLEGKDIKSPDVTWRRWAKLERTQRRPRLLEIWSKRTEGQTSAGLSQASAKLAQICKRAYGRHCYNPKCGILLTRSHGEKIQGRIKIITEVIIKRTTEKRKGQQKIDECLKTVIK